MTLLAVIDLERLARELRIQRIVFETARDVYDAMQADWSGSREVLLAPARPAGRTVPRLRPDHGIGSRVGESPARDRQHGAGAGRSAGGGAGIDLGPAPAGGALRDCHHRMARRRNRRAAGPRGADAPPAHVVAPQDGTAVPVVPQPRAVALLARPVLDRQRAEVGQRNQEAALVHVQALPHAFEGVTRRGEGDGGNRSVREDIGYGDQEPARRSFVPRREMRVRAVAIEPWLRAGQRCPRPAGAG